MKNIFILGLMVLFLVMAQYSRAQSVDDVIGKYLTALGGKEKIDAIKSIFTIGITERNGNEITTQITKVQDKLFRSETNFGMGTATSIITPEKG